MNWLRNLIITAILFLLSFLFRGPVNPFGSALAEGLAMLAIVVVPAVVLMQIQRVGPTPARLAVRGLMLLYLVAALAGGMFYLIFFAEQGFLKVTLTVALWLAVCGLMIGWASTHKTTSRRKSIFERASN
jgi:hypothetical protein